MPPVATPTPLPLPAMPLLLLHWTLVWPASCTHRATAAMHTLAAAVTAAASSIHPYRRWSIPPVWHLLRQPLLLARVSCIVRVGLRPAVRACSNRLVPGTMTTTSSSITRPAIWIIGLRRVATHRRWLPVLLLLLPPAAGTAAAMQWLLLLVVTRLLILLPGGLPTVAYRLLLLLLRQLL